MNTEFKIGQRVKVDDEPLGVVTAITFRAHGLVARQFNVSYEVGWFASGEAKSAWFDEWRLSI